MCKLCERICTSHLKIVSFIVWYGIHTDLRLGVCEVYVDTLWKVQHVLIKTGYILYTLTSCQSVLIDKI